MNLLLTFELISVDVWDVPLPEGFRLIRTLSGYGNDKFATMSQISESLPFGMAVELLISEHTAAREIAERERAKG